MTLQKTITAGELADRENPTARAIWAAVQRGELRLTADGCPVTDIRIDAMYNWLEVTLSDTFKMPLTSDIRLNIKPVRQSTSTA